MMDEPRFAQPIPNVTVAVGRDANLPCVVEHLGGYKVSAERSGQGEGPASVINRAYAVKHPFAMGRSRRAKLSEINFVNCSQHSLTLGQTLMPN